MSNIGILQHQIDRFGAVTVLDAMFYEYGTNKPVLKLDTLKVSSLTFDGSTKEIRGGLSADLLLTYNHSRSVNMEITDALASLYSLQLLWGATLQDVKAVRTQETLKAKTENTLPEFTKTFVKKSGEATPEVGVDLIYVNETKGEYITSTEELTGKIAVGDVITAYGFIAPVAEENPLELVLKSSSFPQRVTLVGRTVFLDEKTGKEVLAEIEIPKFSFGNTFDLALDAEGDAATFNMSGMALADGKDKELIKLKTLKKGTGLLDDPWNV